MKKIILSMFSLLVICFFLVSCAPQITDEELKSELAKLTPEEREELLADLKASESGAFAGQAVKITEKTYSSKISPKVLKESSERIEKQIEMVSEVLETPSAKATLFCNDLKNEGKYTHYCSETNTDIKYDKFKCVTYEKTGGTAIHKIDTTYPKDKLYPQVDTCKEILATFLNQKEYGTIGCYDSDGGSVIDKAGYIEAYSIHTGNKAPGAYADTAPTKEIDACAGLDVKSGLFAVPGWLSGEVVGCSAGYFDGGVPTSGYVGETTTCFFQWRLNSNQDWVNILAYGTRLFERKCPALFESPGVEYVTEIVDNCPYLTGNHCIAGKCDSSKPADFDTLGLKGGYEPSCKGVEKCKKFKYIWKLK